LVSNEPDGNEIIASRQLTIITAKGG